MKNKPVRWVLSVLLILLVPFVWKLTATDWATEVFGVYTFNRAAFNILVSLLILAVVYILLARRTFRYKLLSVLTAFMTTGIGLLLFELPVLLSDFDYQKLLGTAGSKNAQHLTDKVNKPDPVLMHKHWPDSSFSGEVVGNLAQLGIPRPVYHSVDVQYDHNGFRNDRPYSRADIAVVGDSFVEAAIVPLEQSLVKQLEQQLNVPVVNLGQIAYGFKQELEVLKRYALPLSPHVVVWALFGGNDLRDVEWYEDMLKNFGKPEAPEPLKDRLFTRNLLVASSNLLMTAIRTKPSRKAINHSGLFKREDGVRERVYFGQTNDPWNEHQWAVATETLKKARDLSNSSNIDFVVVYIPRKFRIYQPYLELDPDTEIAHWKVAALPQALSRWCEKNDISFIDTTPALSDAVAKGVNPYFIDDVHWNALGHKIAADTIVNYLEKNKLYPFTGTGKSATR